MFKVEGLAGDQYFLFMWSQDSPFIQYYHGICYKYGVKIKNEILYYRKEELQKLRADIDKHKPERDTVEHTCEAVINHAQTDKDLIEPEAKETVDRYDKLDLACSQKIKEADDVQDSLSKYKNALSPVEELLNKIEEAVAEQEPAGADLKKNKDELEKVKVFV